MKTSPSKGIPIAPAIPKPQDLIDLISEIGWFELSSCDKHEENRRKVRLDENGNYTLKTFLRGSASGAKEGPFLSQFLLVDNKERTSNEECTGSYKVKDGYIQCGTQVIDQRVHVHRVGVDFTTDWCSWLDVQNGAKVNEAVGFECDRRFITNPRDLGDLCAL